MDEVYSLSGISWSTKRRIITDDMIEEYKKIIGYYEGEN